MGLHEKNPSSPALPEDRDGFRFRGGCVALDLTATLQARLKSTPRELLALPSDLDHWLISAGLASERPGATEKDLVTARRLREAIFTLAGEAEQSALNISACKVLNRVAASHVATPVLGADRTVQLVGSASELLSAVARQAVYLFGGAEAEHIRQCQSPTCTIFFVDTSRTNDRRWCSMAACGNKAKVAEFRRRKREAQSTH